MKLLNLVCIVSVVSSIPHRLQSKQGDGNGGVRFGEMTHQQHEQLKKSLTLTDMDKMKNVLEKVRERTMAKLEKNAADSVIQFIQSDPSPFDGDLKVVDEVKARTMERVNEENGVGKHLFQGDIALTENQLNQLEESLTESTEGRSKRQAYRGNWYPQNIWSSGVNYVFDASLSAQGRKVALLAMQYWQNNTCINFVENPNAKDRIRFIKSSGCWSYVGKIGGEQPLSLGNGCESFGTAAHEIGHALGFFHEQSRHDRDGSITVMVDNIVDGWVDQFTKEDESYQYNYGIPYDYGSVMHYSGNSVSKNGQPTMVAKQKEYQFTMGADQISFYDVSMMNEHYNCKAKCTNGPRCVNGGFRDSRNCNRCICPTGWAGTTCSERPSGCGQTFVASSTPQTASFSVGKGIVDVDDMFTECTYHIKASCALNKVEVKFVSLNYQQCTSGCVFGGLEVKASGDQRMTGIRHCCSSDAGKTIISDGSVLPLIGFNRYYKQDYTITYRSVDSSTPSTITTGNATTNDAQLLELPYFHGFLPRDELTFLLRKRGDFILRCSDVEKQDKTEKREYIMSVCIGYEKKQAEAPGIRNMVLSKDGPNKKWYLYPQYRFDSVPLLTQYYKNHELISKNGVKVRMTNAVSRSSWELEHGDIELGRHLGKGEFGEVRIGKYKFKGKEVDVAVKLTKGVSDLSKAKRIQMMAEARLMRFIVHPNVVRLYGIGVLQQPLYIVLEFVDGGGLDGYLKKNKAEVTVEQRNLFCLDAAAGVEFIHSKRIIHRDLASRNCLILTNPKRHIVKISDFGLSKIADSYTLKLSGRLPVKWLAPEVLRTFCFTQKSDVWAFGIVVCEIFADGEDVWSLKAVRTNTDVKNMLLAGHLMEMDYIHAELRNYLRERVFNFTETTRAKMSEVTEWLESMTKTHRCPLDDDAIENAKLLREMRMTMEIGNPVTAATAVGNGVAVIATSQEPRTAKEKKKKKKSGMNPPKDDETSMKPPESRPSAVSVGVSSGGEARNCSRKKKRS